MPNISVMVREKIAQTQGTPEIVCGNSDYAVTFDFDDEWSGYEFKTARFVWCDLKTGKVKHSDVVFDGDICMAPVLYDTAAVAIGVYAGDIHTTTPARVPCARCITDGVHEHGEPDPDVYEQILACLREMAKDKASTPIHVTAILIEPVIAGSFENFEFEEG